MDTTLWIIVAIVASLVALFLVSPKTFGYVVGWAIGGVTIGAIWLALISLRIAIWVALVWTLAYFFPTYAADFTAATHLTALHVGIGLGLLSVLLAK